jgi:YafQ family addiction module toxin component
LKELEISEKLQKILKKLLKKDRKRYEIVLNKIDEIINSDAERYKNLSHDMKDFKRVHIDSHFVLVFKVEGNFIKFEDLKHHDHIYG